MIEVEATTRKWGNSLGVILPKDVVQHEHLKENQKIKLPNTKIFDNSKQRSGAWKLSDDFIDSISQYTVI